MILFWCNGFRKYYFIGLDYFICDLSKKASVLQNEECSVLWAECIPPQNWYVEALSPSVMVFEDMAFGE